MLDVPGVESASSMAGHLIGDYHSDLDVMVNGKTLPIHIMDVDYDLIETLGIEMVSGRHYSRTNIDNDKIIFNQAAIDALQLKEAVGTLMNFNNTSVEIIGVTKNFHLQSIYEKVKPMALKLTRNKPWSILVRIKEGNERETVDRIGSFYKNYNPGYPFEYKFLYQYYQSQYVAERRVAALSKYFAVLAVLISCLGLFGLAAFTAERRQKEIGIRKVLGATGVGIISLLSKEFAGIVIIAVFIALPVSYLIAVKWLSHFAFKIQLEWWYFAAAGILSMAVALLTVSVQAIKASKTNAAQCLKDG